MLFQSPNTRFMSFGDEWSIPECLLFWHIWQDFSAISIKAERSLFVVHLSRKTHYPRKSDPNPEKVTAFISEKKCLTFSWDIQWPTVLLLLILCYCVNNIYKNIIDVHSSCGAQVKFITSMKRPSTTLSSKSLTFWKKSSSLLELVGVNDGNQLHQFFGWVSNHPNHISV